MATTMTTNIGGTTNFLTPNSTNSQNTNQISVERSEPQQLSYAENTQPNFTNATVKIVKALPVPKQMEFKDPKNDPDPDGCFCDTTTNNYHHKDLEPDGGTLLLGVDASNNEYSLTIEIMS